jgi:glycogen synthase
MKLFTAIGPGNIVGANRLHLAGKITPETSLAFSEQLFAYCKFSKIETLAISQHPQRDQSRDGIIFLENRSKPSWGKRGLLYHVAEIYYALYLAIRARRFGADIAVIDSGRRITLL